MKSILYAAVFPAFLLLLSLSTVCSQTLDPAFPTVDGTVSTLLVHGNTLYLGGSFTMVGGLPRTNIAAIDIPSKSVTSWAPHLNGDVVDIDARGGKVYFCGHFTQVDGASRNALAAVDSVSGAVDTFNPSISFPGIPGMQTGTVASLKIADNILYFAGYFLSVNGAARKNVAAIDLDLNQITALNVSTDIPVNLIEMNGQALYLGGPFYKVGGAERKGFAAVNRYSGALLQWNPTVGNPGNTMYSILPSNDQIFVGGFFWGLHGMDQCYLANTDLSGTPTTWKPFNCGQPYAYVKSMLLVNDSLVLAGGDFASFDGQSLKNLVLFHKTTGAINAWQPNPDGEVLALAGNDSLLFVAGKFLNIDGTSRQRLAVFHLPDAPTPTPEPDALAFTGFPNPANTDVSIVIPPDGVQNVNVFDQNGARMEVSYQIQDQLLTIQSASLLPGYYVVQMKTADGKKKAVPFLKLR
ncbi:MAG: T9SS type A sorting domain-containing protein [Saprospiraceae bacterium]|nr:T9SS type A sorting domain-containing protein [Saprospiraceae bacterium]